MPEQSNDELVKVIIWVAIAVVYAIVAIARKANKWIEEHRVPTARPEETPYRPIRPAPPVAPRPETPTTLPELVETLMGEQRPKRPEQRVARETPTVREMRYPRPKPVVPVAAPKPAAPRQMPPMAPVQPALRAATAAVHHRAFDHLRALGSKADLKRAILLHEILSPPVAMRRHGAVLPFFLHRRP